jgi:hypothetical protein
MTKGTTINLKNRYILLNSILLHKSLNNMTRRNKFYYLKMLKDEGLVEKINGEYIITSKGIMYMILFELINYNDVSCLPIVNYINDAIIKLSNILENIKSMTKLLHECNALIYNLDGEQMNERIKVVNMMNEILNYAKKVNGNG